MRAARRLAYGAFSPILECLVNCCFVQDRVVDIEQWTQTEDDFGLQYLFDRVKTEPFVHRELHGEPVPKIGGVGDDSAGNRD